MSIALKKKEMPIGVFDSGVGGLTVVKELFRQLPGERVVYFGDTARSPYGNKAKETLIRFGLENGSFLLKKKIKLLVVACNSSSAYCLPSLRQDLGIPVIGVIEPGAQAAEKRTRNRKVGVIGTAATVHSMAYQKALLALNGDIKVFTQACPLFVPLVEEGWQTSPITFLVAQTYLSFLKTKAIDTLVMGCTHYPLLQSVISKVLGPGVALVDSGRETASRVKLLLEEEGLLSPLKKVPVSAHRFFVSDVPEKFINVGRRFLGPKMPPVFQAGP